MRRRKIEVPGQCEVEVRNAAVGVGLRGERAPVVVGAIEVERGQLGQINDAVVVVVGSRERALEHNIWSKFRRALVNVLPQVDVGRGQVEAGIAEIPGLRHGLGCGTGRPCAVREDRGRQNVGHHRSPVIAPCQINISCSAHIYGRGCCLAGTTGQLDAV